MVALTIDGTRVELPAYCIDVKEFVYLILRLRDVSTCLHINAKEQEVRFNWKDGALKGLGQSLKAFREVHNLAVIARVRRTSKVAFELANVYMTNPELRGRVDKEVLARAGELQAMATLMHIEDEIAAR